MALVLDGRTLAATIRDELKTRVAPLPTPPILATILVGDDPASAICVKMKGNACRRIGLRSRKVLLPASTTTEELLARRDELNADPQVQGILLQHPVPAHIDEQRCFDRIALIKNIDGVGAHSFGRMALMLPNADCTVTVCHSKTRDLPQAVSRAGLVVGACGHSSRARGSKRAPASSMPATTRPGSAI